MENPPIGRKVHAALTGDSRQHLSLCLILRNIRTSDADILCPARGLPCRLHRPWLTVNMDRQRVTESLALSDDGRQLPATLTAGLPFKAGRDSADLNRKDEQQFTVRLCADARLWIKREKLPSFSATSQIRRWRR